MGCTPCSGGQTLLLLAAAVSLQLAQGRSAEELGLMSAFFAALGDNLALLAACQPPANTCRDTCAPQQG